MMKKSHLLLLHREAKLFCDTQPKSFGRPRIADFLLHLGTHRLVEVARHCDALADHEQWELAPQRLKKVHLCAVGQEGSVVEQLGRNVDVMLYQNRAVKTSDQGESWSPKNIGISDARQLVTADDIFLTTLTTGRNPSQQVKMNSRGPVLQHNKKVRDGNF
jgi:hypothetical protein